jgi:hypothetical protein
MTDKKVEYAIKRVAWEEIISGVVNLGNLISEPKKYEKHEIDIIFAHTAYTEHVVSTLIINGFPISSLLLDAHTFMKHLLDVYRLIKELEEIETEQPYEAEAEWRPEILEEERIELAENRRIIENVKGIIKDFPVLTRLNLFSIDTAVALFTRFLEKNLDMKIERLRPKEQVPIPKVWSTVLDYIIWRELTIQVSHAITIAE